MNLKSLIQGEIGQSDLFNYYNVSLIYEILPNEIYGFVFNYDGINFIIVNKGLSIYSKKKTILHELAHIELNQLCQYDNDLFAYHVNEYEDEADRYLNRLKQEIVLIDV